MSNELRHKKNYNSGMRDWLEGPYPVLQSKRRFRLPADPPPPPIGDVPSPPDKTGTLTAGKPTLTACRPADGFSADEVLRLAASVEQFSEHPLARAMVAAAQRA